jgi:hypothetical protein
MSNVSSKPDEAASIEISGSEAKPFKTKFIYAEALSAIKDGKLDLYSLKHLLPHPAPKPVTTDPPNLQSTMGSEFTEDLRHRFSMG